MLRLFIYLAVIVGLATGLSWLADRPGKLVINWEGQVVETSVFYAVVLLSVLLGAVLLIWSILRHIWESPAAIGSFLSRRKEKRGLDSLSSGMIAIGAGDRSTATRYAIQARKTLPNEPLTHLLRAQAAQLSGDKATARRIYEGMLNTPDTEQLGLRGLFLEAEKEGELEAARQFAERAVRLNPKLTWPVDALFELQCKSGDWAGALETTAIARKNGQIEKSSADRRRAVLLTAQAQVAEDNDPEKALQLATEAHGLAPGLVPAAAIAGRLLASRGNTPKATKVIQKAWQKSPHPDLAVAYAYSRLGDSPVDRLERVKKLAALNPYSLESPVAAATAAIEAKDYSSARTALEPLLENRLTQRVCTLMARIEGEEFGDKGRVREWLARAVNAPRDPVWTADGIV
ncbi:MAG: heme biosynthesis HemY N-terminal domain-containing protein, partial [Pseudomonadota bacterium]